MVELAIVLPVLLLIVVGIVTFGLYMNNQNQETQLAGTAARFASVDQNPSATPTTQTLQSYILAQATGELGSGSSDVTAAKIYLYYPTGQVGPGTAGTPVIACVISTVSLLPLFGGATIQMTGATTMRIEQAQSYSASTGAGWSSANNSTATVPTQCPTS